jgi:anthranilate/para-aminobenzoate synthase component II
MESVLLQLRFPLKKRTIDKKEPFKLIIPVEYKSDPLFENIKNPMIMRRHHMWYFPNNVINEPIKLLAQYNGEAMLATYKNSTLIQFHPEKSPDGKLLILNWLNQ